MEYVIIGNGVASQSAIKAIRESDQKNRIIVISDESYISYSRPLISYFLGNQVKKKSISHLNEKFYEKNDVELILNNKAVKIDLKAQKVLLEDGKKIHFDKVLIAVGGKPIIPEIKGIQSAGVFNLLKLSDAEGISQYLKEKRVRKAVVIGGGLIGLKTTEALMELGIEVTIIELADRILSASLNKKASNIVEKALKNDNCHLYFNNTVKEIKQKRGRVNEIVLSSDEKILTDLVIISIGVRPNGDLVKDMPIKHKNGIIVNQYMETNVQNIFAAGDCCAAKDLFAEKNRLIAIWPIAVKQGRIAGYNLSSKKTLYPGGFPMNSVELCGIPVMSVGMSDPKNIDCEIFEEFKPNKSIYKKMIIRDNQLKGFILVGDIDRAGIYTGLIRNAINISSIKNKLLKNNFGLLNLPETYRKDLITEKEVSINVY